MNPVRYLDLLESSLINEIYLENEVRLLYAFSMMVAGQPIDGDVVRRIRERLPDLVEEVRVARESGRVGWWNVEITKPDGTPTMVDLRNLCDFAHTMVGRARLRNLRAGLDIIRNELIPGDLVETGVWRGGCCIFMRGYLEAYGMTDRRIWACDSFEGLPRSSHPEDAGLDMSADKMPILAVTLDEVQENFRRYDLLDDRVVFVKGWFKDTLKSIDVDQIALLRLDGDLYESTMDSLEALYDKVSPGGVIIIDDYFDFEPCRKAVDHFRQSRGISDQIHPVDWSCAWWRKGERKPMVRGFSTSLCRENLRTIQEASHEYSWKGIPLWKNPFDFANYWRLVWFMKPRTIIEIGSKYGGSAIWFADMMDVYGIDGRVISVDIAPPQGVSHERVTFLRGDASDLSSSLVPEMMASLPHPWLVIEDSSHMASHCLAAIEYLDRFMVPGDILSVEDGIVSDLGIASSYEGGPSLAIREFIEKRPMQYELLVEMCDFWGQNVTWNPNGYWRKVRA